MTKSRGILTPKRKWTDAEVAMLRHRYPDAQAADLARELGCKIHVVYKMATKLGLKKSAAFLAGGQSGRLSRSNCELGAKFRFQKGESPWSKGLTGLDMGGRSRDTRFKPGAVPYNKLPVGSQVIASIGQWKEKVAEPNKWRFVHVMNWEAVHGPMPKKHVLRFIDGNSLNPAIDNLKLLTNAEHLATLTIARFSPELRSLIHLSAKLRRTIEAREHEKQD